MRLIRQVTLFLREGTSDKVYEVDLCEAGEGEFVVNFRYGRRGTTLREGTKTTFPVDRAEAEDVYEKLVTSKTNKGYSTTLPEAGAQPAEPPRVTTASDPRARRVLRYLKAAALGDEEPAEEWPLSRILWRAGEMGLREAAPYLAKMTGNGDDMHDVSLAWALGRCGDESCTGALRRLLASTTSEPAKRFAEAALLDLSDPSDREDLLARQIALLPASVAAVLYGAPQDVVSALQEALQRTEGPQEVLVHLYLISPYIAGARVAVVEALRRLPLGPDTFQPVRRIYKLAEFRSDADVYGLLAYRFEKTPEAYRSIYGRMWAADGWHWIKDLARSDRRLAYSKNTRAYLRLRSIRTLTRLGELGLDLYATMATGVLLAFNDEFDRKKPRMTTQYVWDRRGHQVIETDFDVYDYPLLNHLLYAHSTRYVPKKGLKPWPCAGTYRPGHPAPEAREEAFPKIWDRNPKAIVRLLRESSCLAVHEFAVKVFRANPSFAEQVSVDDLIEILTRPYEITARLAIDLAKRLYDPSQPSLPLVSGLATSASEAGRALAIAWIGEQPGVFLRDRDFLLTILLTPHADVHGAIRRLLAGAGVEEETLRVVAFSAIDRLLSLDVRPGNSELTRVVGETLLTIAKEPLSRIEIAILLLMLDHPLDEVQALGGRLLINHEIPATQLDEAVFEKLINATSPAARRAGVELFGSLPDDVLLERQATLATLATSKRPELRDSVRPIIARLAARDDEFARGMVEQFYPLLARKERYEGFHADVYQLLVESLGAQLSTIPHEHIDKLLDSKYERAQELGARLLESQVTPAQVPIRRLVRLGSHEALSVRAWVRRAYTEDPERVKRELEESVRLVDSTWDDTRDFAFDFFRTHLTEADWKPEVLVAVADSVNKAVQSFGRELITRFFDEQHGQTYLLRLSQHPSPDLQLFATNYLERFAAGHDDRIEGLELYFVTVLCQVNRGRVAKDRILRFLQREALRSEATARLVARILVRQSATIAIGDKAACIATLRSIEGAYPQMVTPLRVRKPPVRGFH